MLMYGEIKVGTLHTASAVHCVHAVACAGSGLDPIYQFSSVLDHRPYRSANREERKKMNKRRLSKSWDRSENRKKGDIEFRHPELQVETKPKKSKWSGKRKGGRGYS